MILRSELLRERVSAGISRGSVGSTGSSDVIELPHSPPVGQADRCRKVTHELLPGDFFRPKTHDIWRGLLAIHDSKSPGMQLSHE